jgi:hypothetical protein
VYGKNIPFRAVLSGKTATPEIAAEFMKAVSDASRQAHVAEAKEEARK